MLLHRHISIVLAAGAACASMANGQIVYQAINITTGVGTLSQTTPDACPPGTGLAWSVNFSNITGTGFLFSQFVPIPLTSYGIDTADLSAQGVISGVLPGILWTRHFSFTEVGAPTPTYDFTLSVSLDANRSVTSRLQVASLGSFAAGGITGSPFDVELSAISAQGTVQAAPLIPAPGAAVLLGAGAALAARRRRA